MLETGLLAKDLGGLQQWLRQTPGWGTAGPWCHQKRQEPRRPWAWRRLADRERLMCLVVERTLSAAWTARLRALLSSSRSSRSNWIECRCLLASREGAVGGHSAAGRAEGAEVGPPGDA